MSQSTITAAEIQRMGGLVKFLLHEAMFPTQAPPKQAQPAAVPQGKAQAAAPKEDEEQAVAPKEDEEQAVVIRWAHVREMCCPALALLFHIPNGGARHKATAGRLRAQGVKPGVPDLLLPVPRDGCHGLWIEMKRIKSGRVSPEQEDWHTRLRARGYRVEVCRGAAEAIAVLKDYLGMKA